MAYKIIDVIFAYMNQNNITKNMNAHIFLLASRTA